MRFPKHLSQLGSCRAETMSSRGAHPTLLSDDIGLPDRMGGWRFTPEWGHLACAGAKRTMSRWRGMCRLGACPP